MKDTTEQELIAYLHDMFEPQGERWPCEEEFCTETFPGMADMVLPFVRKVQARAWFEGRSAPQNGVTNNPYVETP